MLETVPITSISSVINLTVDLMQQVARMPSLKGPEKKQLVMDTLMSAIKAIPDESNGPGDTETLLLQIIPTVIDWIVVSSKGRLSLNPLFTTCCPIC
jgi:hypothetical protein